MKLSLLAALKDNYIWILHNQQKALLVDPTLAQPAIDFLQQNNLVLTAILITHHHWDHIDGLEQLYRTYQPQVYAPNNPQAIKVPFMNVNALTELSWQDLSIQVIQTPGHTLTHCCYFITAKELPEPILFSGDTLFSAGCGRIFEGTAQQMYSSLQRLKSLPAQTLVCSGHDYTLSNLQFANAVEPSNLAIQQDIAKYNLRVNQGLPCIPSTLQRELLTNPFLRVAETAVKHRVENKFNQQFANVVEVFAALRQWKNEF